MKAEFETCDCRNGEVDCNLIDRLPSSSSWFSQRLQHRRTFLSILWEYFSWLNCSTWHKKYGTQSSIANSHKYELLKKDKRISQSKLAARRYAIAQLANLAIFVQWVYWVYLFCQNTCPQCAHCAMHEQV